MNKELVLIAAGGTGGHIYPALAIAASLKKMFPNLDVEFVGSPIGLENKLVPREGFTLHSLKVGRLNNNVRPTERLKTLLSLPILLFKAFLLVRRKKPKFILGVGGAVTGPVVLAGILSKIPTFIWEPNAHPGLANRWLSPWVTECLLVFKAAAKKISTRRVSIVGMPVREELKSLPRKVLPSGLKKEVSVAAEQFKVFIFGGSQGSRAINNIVSQAIIEGGDWIHNVTFIHQTGPTDFQRIRQIYAQGKYPVEVMDYVYDMNTKYQWADVVVSRSGFGTIAELATCQKASILIPLPTASDNHQQANAEVLVEKNATIMILQKEFTVDRFKEMILYLKNNPKQVEMLEENVAQFYQPNAAQNIAKHLMEASK